VTKLINPTNHSNIPRRDRFEDPQRLHLRSPPSLLEDVTHLIRRPPLEPSCVSFAAQKTRPLTFSYICTEAICGRADQKGEGSFPLSLLPPIPFRQGFSFVDPSFMSSHRLSAPVGSFFGILLRGSACALTPARSSYNGQRFPASGRRTRSIRKPLCAEISERLTPKRFPGPGSFGFNLDFCRLRRNARDFYSHARFPQGRSPYNHGPARLFFFLFFSGETRLPNESHIPIPNPPGNLDGQTPAYFGSFFLLFRCEVRPP